MPAALLAAAWVLGDGTGGSRGGGAGRGGGHLRAAGALVERRVGARGGRGARRSAARWGQCGGKE